MDIGKQNDKMGIDNKGVAELVVKTCHTKTKRLLRSTFFLLNILIFI